MDEGLKNKFYVGQDVFYLNSCKRSYFHAKIQHIELRFTPSTEERYLLYVVEGDNTQDSCVYEESELFATEKEAKKEIIRILQHECTNAQNKLQEYIKAFGFEDETTEGESSK